MTAGTVVITGGILATVILLCIVIVLCYCRLQYYCCKREELETESDSDSDELQEEASLTMSSRLPLDAMTTYAANGPCVYSPALPPQLVRSHTYCPSCVHRELPYLPAPLASHQCGLHNGCGRLDYQTASASRWGSSLAPERLHFCRSVTMKEMFTRGYSVSTDV